MAKQDEKQSTASAEGQPVTAPSDELNQNEGYRYEPVLNPETGQVESVKRTFKVDPKTGLEAK